MVSLDYAAHPKLNKCRGNTPKQSIVKMLKNKEIMNSLKSWRKGYIMYTGTQIQKAMDFSSETKWARSIISIWINLHFLLIDGIEHIAMSGLPIHISSFINSVNLFPIFIEFIVLSLRMKSSIHLLDTSPLLDTMYY